MSEFPSLNLNTAQPFGIEFETNEKLRRQVISCLNDSPYSEAILQGLEINRLSAKEVQAMCDISDAQKREQVAGALASRVASFNVARGRKLDFDRQTGPTRNAVLSALKRPGDFQKPRPIAFQLPPKGESIDYINEPQDFPELAHYEALVAWHRGAWLEVNSVEALKKLWSEHSGKTLRVLRINTSESPYNLVEEAA